MKQDSFHLGDDGSFAMVSKSPISWRRFRRTASLVRRPVRNIVRRGSSRRPSARRTRRTATARRARSEPHLDGEDPPEPDPLTQRALRPALDGGGR